LPGPQWDWFLNPDALTTGEYVVNMNSNRMGLRLNGPMLERRPGELVSEAVAPGAMQITNEGQPIILGVDGQTIGGYPKVAHLILADLDRLAQLRPGMPIGFTLVTPAEASALRIARETHLREWLTRLAVAPLL
jgi:allophanate hydrolase subunit 2